MIQFTVNTLKSWKVMRVSPTKKEQALVNIQSRRFGLVSRILSYFKIDLVTNFIVYKNRVDYESGNILGSRRVTIPMKNITSVHSGHQKPIIEAVLVASITILFLKFFGGTILAILADVFKFKYQTVLSIRPWIGFISLVNGAGFGLMYFLFVNLLYLGIVESGDNKYGVTIREFPWSKRGANKTGKNKKLADASATVILRLIQAHK